MLTQWEQAYLKSIVFTGGAQAYYASIIQVDMNRDQFNHLTANLARATITPKQTEQSSLPAGTYPAQVFHVQLASNYSTHHGIRTLPISLPKGSPQMSEHPGITARARRSTGHFELRIVSCTKNGEEF